MDDIAMGNFLNKKEQTVRRSHRYRIDIETLRVN